MAAKIKDGLFIGDEETSQSEIFINDNKISNLINLSGREVPNVWASHGLVYLTYNWEDRPDYRLFSGHEDSILTDIIEFVDVSIAHGISVLMFSKKGTGRAAVAACLYLMVKYRWGFEKSYDYVYSKKPDIDLNKGFIQQMFALDMKLVASRQKAYALKHGIENTFKIEPNMTINDIAAMLPSTEAKRWNSWDPSYVLTPNSTTTDSRPVTQDNIEEVVTWQKYAEPVVSALRKKDQIVVKVMLNKTKGNLRALDDAEEELVLIFSFINAKNTISTLPGPYYNAYEVQKQFALRFDSVVFEEDVNWFPTSPSSSRYTYAPKGILKGVQRPLLTASSKQPSTSDMSQHKPTSNNNNNAASAGGARDDKHAMSPPHVGLANPRNSIEIRSTKTNTATPPVADDDLLKYVGISAAAQSKDDGNNGHYSNSNNHASAPSNVAPPKRTTPASAAYEDKSANPPANTADYDRKPMTAEERLRKLMADMERQKPASTASSARSGSNTGTRGSSNNAANDNANAGGGAPSLYDLANMQVHASSAAAAANTGSGGGARGGPTGPSGSSGYGTASGRGGSHGNQDFAMEDFDEDDDLDDPLAAFDVPTSHAASNRGGSSTAAGPGATSSAGGKTGALRARHDILANTTSGVGSTSRTGTNSMTASGGRSSSLNNTTGGSGSRPQAWGTSSSGGGVSNRYASPSSVRSSGTNNVPSSNSSIASQASDARVGSGGGGSGGAYVGSGTTSGTQVYRHGSPAPNNRPATGGLSSSGARRSTTGSGTAAGSGGRVASSSNNSVGSMGSNGLNGVYGTGLGGSSGPSGRFSPAPSPSTAKSTRYSSPFVAGPTSSGSGGGGATGYDSGAAPRGSTPQRRGSNSSINSMGSAGNGSNSGGPVSSSGYGPASSGARRSVGTASPMRASYGGTTSGGTSGSRPASPASFGNTTGGIGTSSSGVPAKRFSTPTPHDYDNSSAGSNRPGSASSAGRNNTPSKASWRF